MSDAKNDFSEALWRLLEDKDFDDVTVVDIVRVSGRSHASFYRNLEDKYALMLYACEALFKPAIAAGLRNSQPEDAVEPFLFIAVSNKRKILHALSSLEERALRRQIIEKLTHYAQLRLEALPSFDGNVNTRAAGLIFSNSVMGIFIDWLSGNVQLSFAEMREILIQWLRRLGNMGSLEEIQGDIDVGRSMNPIERVVFEQLEDKTIDELRVGKIIEDAGVKRSAFYRQYKDKYDVVNRHFERLSNLRLTIRAQSGRVVVLTHDRVHAYLDDMLKHRQIVLNALSTADPNGLRQFAIEYLTQLLVDFAHQVDVQDAQQLETMIRMFSIGAVGHVIFWLKAPRQSTEEVLDSLRLLFPAELLSMANDLNTSDMNRGDADE